ncbi:MAG: NAD(P)-binding protein, partial [Woeseiaceae bacterium]|nr:NAD(P)-binding protein [Woeseiaceae bacterium]
MVAGASVIPGIGNVNDAMASINSSYYPPAEHGLRGSHPGSNDVAHTKAWSGKTNWGATSKVDDEYDLIVVGGGISGLAAAYFYQQQYGRDKKILILDNHDDFGGH